MAWALPHVLVYRRGRAWCDAFRHCGIIADGETDPPDTAFIIPPSHPAEPTLNDRSRYNIRPQ